jgi:hypothetical protein
MHKNNSMIAGASRNIGVNAVTTAIAPRRSSATPFIRSIYQSARRWMAGRRADIQIISVQRGDFSVIT